MVDLLVETAGMARDGGRERGRWERRRGESIATREVTSPTPPPLPALA